MCKITKQNTKSQHHITVTDMPDCIAFLSVVSYIRLCVTLKHLGDEEHSEVEHPDQWQAHSREQEDSANNLPLSSTT